LAHPMGIFFQRENEAGQKDDVVAGFHH
jgi:hypothetical protein